MTTYCKVPGCPAPDTPHSIVVWAVGDGDTNETAVNGCILWQLDVLAHTLVVVEQDFMDMCRKRGMPDTVTIAILKSVLNAGARKPDRVTLYDSKR
jgi:hypothetical protein